MSWPRIGKINWHNREWGTQTIHIPAGGHYAKVGPKVWVRGIQCGYVKIWRKVNGQPTVVDTALSIRKAKERIKQIKEREMEMGIDQSRLLQIETATKDGTVILATHNRHGSFVPMYETCWATPERRAEDGYIVNNGNPWWLKPCRKWMAPTPTHWMPE